MASASNTNRTPGPNERLEYEDVFNRGSQHPTQQQLQNISAQQQPHQYNSQMSQQQGYQQSPQQQYNNSNKQYPQIMQTKQQHVPNQTNYLNNQQQQPTRHLPGSSGQTRYPHGEQQTGYPPQRQMATARPHSADFLDYERKHPLPAQQQEQVLNQEFLDQDPRMKKSKYNSTTPNRFTRHRTSHTGGGGPYQQNNLQPPRPKSSIDYRSPRIDLEAVGSYDDNHINDVAIEMSNYDQWSEEAYAEKMRRMNMNVGGSRSRSQSRASQQYNYGADPTQGGGEGPPANAFNNNTSSAHQFLENHIHVSPQQQQDVLKVDFIMFWYNDNIEIQI